MGVVLLAAGVHGGVVAAVTPEQHAATIREALNVGPLPPTTWGKEQLDEAHDALDALVALADPAAVDRWMSRAHYWNERAVAAEVRASQLEHERDELEQQIIEYQVSSTTEADETHHWVQRAEHAEREADQLRAALEAVADGSWKERG